MVAACDHPRETTSVLKENEGKLKSDTVSSVVESSSDNSELEDGVMEGFEETEFTTVFSEEGVEISTREIGYQHGHTIFTIAMNLYKNEKLNYTDTIPFFADGNEFELLHLADSTRILKISGEWSNFGASSYQEHFFLIDSTMVPLNAISGYCGGNHYNFDSDSTCISPYTDGDRYHHTLYREKGERYLTVFKEGYYVEGEDPCKNGFETVLVLQKSVIDQDSLVLFYSEEKRGTDIKVLKSISKKSAEAKLASFRKIHDK